MSETTNILWTISELAAEVAALLSAEDVDQSSGRVSGVPSTRTIRYYTTHGLLDRPLDFRGRTALYGQRHMMQLVAIKRLQARGVALTEIQERVAGASDQELAELAGLASEPVTKQEEAPRRGDSFWSAPVPAPPSKASNVAQQATIVPSIALTGEVTLVLQGALRELYGDDLEAIRVAAEPLLKLLKHRHIVDGT